MSSAVSGWCCRRFPVCSGAAPPPPDAYEGCESHKASVCRENTMRIYSDLTDSILDLVTMRWRQGISWICTLSLICPYEPATPDP